MIDEPRPELALQPEWKKPENHVSVSQLGRYRRCGYQDFLYLTKGPRPPGIAQLQGAATHDVAAGSMRRKRDTGVAFTPDEARDIAAGHIDALVLKGGVRLTDEEHEEGEARVLGRAKDFAIAASGAHADAIAPKIDPEVVEAEIVSPGPVIEGKYLVGRLDLADRQNVVRDLKSTASKATVGARVADTSPQLTVYAALFEMWKGELPMAVALDAVIVGPERKDGSRNVDTATTLSVRNREDIVLVYEQMSTLVRGRDAGIFMPVDASGPQGWVCSKKWCGYTDICKFYRKERDRNA